jgi:hypothetical protein
MAKPPAKSAKPPPKPPAKAPPKPKAIVPPITSPKIRHIAGEAAAHPGNLTDKEISELGASVLRHIEPRRGGKP